MTHVDESEAAIEADQVLRYARDLRKAAERERIGSHELQRAAAQLEVYAKDLQKALAQQQSALHSLDLLEGQALDSLQRVLELCDSETARHGRRVACYAELIARWCERPASDIHAIGVAARLHDLGVLALPDGVRTEEPDDRPGERLDAHEHAARGAALIPSIPLPKMSCVREVLLHHHERWNGAGYPHAMSGHAIPIAARIVALADVYDAMLSVRDGGTLPSPAECTSALLGDTASGIRGRFDPELLDLLARQRGELEDAAARVRCDSD